MRKMKSMMTALCILAMPAVSQLHALETLSMLETGPSRTLLERKNPIKATTKGTLPVKFVGMMRVLSEPDFLENIQRAYSELIIEGETPEFRINKTSDKTYYYINKNGERTDILEVLRRKTSDTTFDIILLSSGKRFFGNYEALIHVQITRKGEQVDYVSSVYAYPENVISRFLARRLGLIERYFRNKASHMTGIISIISCKLCEQVEEPTRLASAN
jgi:hypothetical protein